MWTLAKSRGRFRHLHAAEMVTESAPYLGRRLPDGQHGNFEVLDEFMRAVPLSPVSGRNVDGVFCGVARTDATAANEVLAKAAVITISEQYITALEIASGLFLAYRHMLSALDTVHRERGLEAALLMLATSRKSAVDFSQARQRDRAFAGEDSDVWGLYLSHPECTELAKSALLWTVCHELAHMIQGDGTSRVDTRLRAERAEMASRLPDQWWPRSASHQDELIADWAGLEMAARSSDHAAQLPRLMPATVIAATALAIDGWHLDQSAASESHPSPSLRVETLGCYWLEYLNLSRESNWAECAKPSDGALLQLALAITFGRWIAGRYREGRDGLSIAVDLSEVVGFARTAVGDADLS